MQSKSLITNNVSKLASIIIDSTIGEHERYLEVKKILSEDKELVTKKYASLTSETWLHLAVRYNRFDIVLLLLDSGVDINATDSNNETALHRAAEFDLVEMVILLCYYHADVTIFNTQNQETALHFAAKNGHLNCVQILLSLQPTLLGQKQELLEKYSNKKFTAELQQIFSIDYHSLGRTALHYAVIHNLHKTVSQILVLDTGDMLNKPDKDRYTPLHYAAQYGFSVILLMLCHRPDINLNSTNANGDTAMHLCAKNNHPECMKILATTYKSIQREFRNNEGKTAEELILEITDNRQQEQLKESFYSIQRKRSTVSYETELFGKTPRNTNEKEHAKPILLKSNSSEKKEIKEHTSFKKTRSLSDEELNLLERYKREKKAFDIDINKLENELQKTLLSYGLEQSYPVSEVKNITNDEFAALARSLDFEKKLQDSPILSNSVSRHRITSISSFVQTIKPDCLQAVYSACMGKNENDVLKIDMEDIYINTIGLLIYYKPHEIISALSLLGNHLSNHQNLIGSIHVKNIFLLGFEFDYDLSSSDFNVSFSNYIENNCLKKLGSTLEKIKELTLKFLALTMHTDYRSFISKTLCSPNLVDISKEINRTINNKGSDIKSKAKFLALELNNLTAAFYQKCAISEYNSPDKKPHITTQKELFNIFTFFVPYHILSQPSAKLRARAITLFVLAAEYCRDYHLGAELHYTVAISVALQFNCITRLTATFNLLDKKILRKIESMEKLSNPAVNYKDYRNYSKEHPQNIPYLGFILRENDLIQEGKPPHSAIPFLGKLFAPLIDLRKRLECHVLMNKSDLFSQLQSKQFTSLSIEEIDRMSFFAEPKIPNLTNKKNPCTIAEFSSVLEKFKQYKHPLQIIYHEKIFEGTKALEKIDEWLLPLSKTSVESQQASKLYKDCHNFVSDNYGISQVKKETPRLNNNTNSPMVLTILDQEKVSESPITTPHAQENEKNNVLNENKGLRFFPGWNNNSHKLETKKEENNEESSYSI